ncbi:MAG: class I SAM-dependent methyltransferase [Acetobacteraceae bacterium]|nr:class I SAM-dependent methyltransferase [Acetobacteraceae bacterium]
MDLAEYTVMDKAESQMWWYRALHARLLSALAPVQGRILDAGCGTGGFLAVLRAKRPDLACIGVEWAEQAVLRAARKSGLPVVRGSINCLPLAPACIDAAVTADVLCHAAVDPAAALAELRRILRPGGLLVVNMPAYAWMLSAHDRRVHNVLRQTAGQTARMLRDAGFVGVRAHYWNSLLMPLMLIQRKILAAGRTRSAVAPFPPWLDAIMLSMTELERRLPFHLPAGGSVLATAERP